MAKGKKTGGRQKGTPNKDNPLKCVLRAHSEAYFTPRMQLDNNETMREVSDFDLNMELLDPADRVSAEIRLLEFHTPKLKAVDVDLEAKVAVKTIEDRLRSLCNGDLDLDDDDE